MKRWYRALPAKIILFVLCIVTLAVACGCVVGVAAMAVGGIYQHTEQYTVQSDWYGMMERDAYSIVYETVHNDSSLLRYEADATNLRYAVRSPENEILATNLSAPEKVGMWDYSFYYTVYTDEWGTHVSYTTPDMTTENLYMVQMYLVSGLPVKDAYAFTQQLYASIYAMRYAVIPVGIVSAVLCFVSFIVLMCVSGRRREDNDLHPGYFYRVPFDLMLAFTVLLFVFAVEVIVGLSYTQETLAVVSLAALALTAACAFVLLCMSFACRIKGKTLVQNTVFAMACRMVRKAMLWLRDRIRHLVSALPLIPKTVAALIASLLLDLILLTAAYDGAELAMALWIAKTLVLCLAVLYASISMRELQKAGRALAKGELSYRVDTEKMKGDFRRHGEDLNNISKGMALAVEERIKSERMKAELVTNVSHDIKTPLTSIINYAALVASEPCDNEKHGEYAEVLVRKSEHLKRLLEDLVEISKANTGNLEVNLQPMDAGVLISQTAGEFAERCEAEGLFLVTSVTDEKMEIMADGRRLWRVFENLMNNALKYSLTGSRVYLSLHREKEQAVFTIRNTSKQALNISPEELTERFVRGDASRSTEGSGLGLSIAKSLTELQNGSMELSIDGDLFKVILRFKVL